MKKPEILAPAGSMESLIAAVNCGADAVYLGAKTLNARRNAGNFDDEALAAAVRYAHLHGVSILQTLNILMFDDEIDSLIEAAKTAARLGIDGAIVQDWGVLSILKRTVPELFLAASTQMAVHNLEGAKMAQKLGCSRVVLARELTAAEIKHITENVSIQTEVFVHGALCMSVSGQCYLSSMLGGRSGNRGLCAQPCRLPFSAGDSTHALSLKDLSLTERVSELCALGVSSLKIEGRMKRPEYVAASVTALRQALAGEKPDMERLRSVFSRSGFTTGYFDDKRDGGMFGIRDKEDVTAASGVLGALSQLAARDIGKVGLQGAFTAYEGEPVSLALRDNDKNSVFAEGEAPQKALNKPTDEQRVRQSLEKTGGTPFHFDELDIELGDGLMIPVSQINSLRREALDKLCELRQKTVSKRFIPFEAPPQPSAAAFKKPFLRARCRADQLSKPLLERCRDFVIPLRDITAALSAGLSPERVIAEIPRILFSRSDEVSAQLSAAARQGISHAWCGNIGAIPLADMAKMRAVGGWSLNITNSPALKTAFCDLGIAETELSFELSLPDAKRLAHGGCCGIIAYGSLPLMAFRNCPIKARIGCSDCRRQGELTDRMGVSFPVRCPYDAPNSGESELYNSVPLYLGDRINELSGFDFLTLWFSDESAQRCADVAFAYSGSGEPMKNGSFTRGLYYRTVL